MIANYHTHTYRCGHAAPAAEVEYVRAAIERGLTTLGFADHSPQLYPNGYVSTIRMLPEQLADYCSCVRAAGEAYRGQITVRLGVEAEYYPALFSELLPMLRDQGVEYMLLGQHFLDNDMGAPYCGWATDSEDILRRYCRQVRDAMETGLFTYLAHPDLMHYTGDEKTYAAHMRPLCREAARMGLPLEINLLGLEENRHYPKRRFWELAAEEGCPVVLGVDAHAPDRLLRTGPEEKAMAMARELGLQVLPDIVLQPI